MIDSRRIAKAKPSVAHSPSSSGPRCTMLAFIFAAVSAACERDIRPTRPTMPHIEGSVVVSAGPEAPAETARPGFLCPGRQNQTEPRQQGMEDGIQIGAERFDSQIRTVSAKHLAQFAFRHRPGMRIAFRARAVAVSTRQLERIEETTFIVQQALNPQRLVPVKKRPAIVEHYPKSASPLEYPHQLVKRLLEIRRVVEHAPAVDIIERAICEGQLSRVHSLDCALEAHQFETHARLRDAGRIEVHGGDVSAALRPVHCQRAKTTADLEHAFTAIFFVWEKPVEWT